MRSIQLGVLAGLDEGPEHAIEKVHSLGFPTCQVSCWQGAQLDDAMAQRLRAAAEQNKVEITTIWAGLPGRHVWL